MYLKYGISKALRNLWKNWRSSLNSILIVSASLSILGMISLLYLNVMHLSTLWLSNTTVSLFLTEETASEDRTRLLERVREHPMVRSARLISPEEGMSQLSEKLGIDRTALTGSDRKTLPFTIDVEIFLDYRKRISDVAARFNKLKGVSDVLYAERMFDQVETFFMATKAIGVFFIGLILVSFWLVIANATKLSLHARRKEIEILHLAGATRGFIRSAFIYEGMLLAFGGAAFSLIISYLSFKLMVAGITWDTFTFTLRDTVMFFPFLLQLASLGVITLLGGASSFKSVNQILNQLEP